MKFITKDAKITAPSTTDCWSTVFSENGLFLLLEIAGDSANPAAKLGKETLDTILTKFTNYRQKNLKTLEELLSNFKDNKNITTLIIGLLEDDNLYLGNIGKGTVFLKRADRLGKILTNSETSFGKGQIGDKILFYSDTFADLFGEEKRQQILSVDDSSEAQEKIASLIFGDTKTEGVAILVVYISEKEKTQQSLDREAVWEEGRERIVHLKEKIRNVINGSRFRFKDDEESKSKRTLLSIAVVLIILLTVSIFLNIDYTQSSKRQKQIAETLELVSHQYEEAVSLLDLNPVRARELLSAGKLSLASLISQFPKNSKEYKEINEWLAKLSSQEVVAYKIYKLTGVPLFYDLTLIKQEGVGDKIVSYKDNKAVLDTKNKVIYSLSTKTKQAEMIAGGDTVKDAQTLDIHGKNVYILNSDGVVQIDIASKTARVVIKKDEKWGEIISLASFGGNIYLLDRKNNAIWKYIATDFGFLQKTNYLNPDVRADFAGSSKMIIDGSVWILQSGNIIKFTKGLGEPFSFKGISDSIDNIISFATSGEERFLYILDKTLSRIIVFDKDGNYQSQYQWDELQNATDLFASEEEKKIFVLMGSKIYAIEIK